MSNLGVELTAKVVKALTQYSEYQVARMYGLQLSTVRAIKMEAQRHVDDLNSRRQQDLFNESMKSLTGRKQETDLEMGIRIHKQLDEHLKRTQYKAPNESVLVRADYAGLERHVIAGFFTPDGKPTPAFWGYFSHYAKKSGHALLDILHDEQIFSPEQLKEALDFDYQLSQVPLHRKLAIVNQILKEIQGDYVKDPNTAGNGIQNGE